MLFSVLANLVADLHRAEGRAAHRTKVGGLSAILRERFVVEGEGFLGIEAEVELILPPELKSSLAHGVVTFLSCGMAFRQVSA